MASIERYRPIREGYQPPSLPAARPPPGGGTASGSSSGPPAPQDLHPQAVSSLRQRDVPPAVPSPPMHSSRTSPPRPGQQKPHSQSQLSQRPLSSSAASQQQPHPQQRSQQRPPPNQRPLPPSRDQPHQQHQHQNRPTRNGTASSPATAPPLASQWYYTEAEMQCTPSVLHGLSPHEEQMRRAKGVNFIYQSGIAVQPHSLPQVTLYVAAVFFHRFYMRASMVEEHGGIHHYKIAATALFLANKTEENCFKTKNLIIAVAKTAQKNFNMIVDEQSKEYWRWRDSILAYEEYMLETLTFDLMIANPYNQLWAQLRKLGQLQSKPIREAAWTFLNDAALTTLPLLLDARDIASASIFFASVASGEKIDDVHSEPWWQFLGADQDRITRAIQIMSTFYTENPLRKQGGIRGSPVFSLETTRRPHELIPPHGSLGAPPGTAAGNGHLDHGLLPRDSRDVTPMELDRQPQQQQTRTSSQKKNDASFAGNASQAQSDAPLLSQQVSGASDVALKAAANDLGRHAHSPSYYKASLDRNDNDGSASLGSGSISFSHSQSLSPDKKRRKDSIDADDDGPLDGDSHRLKRPKQTDRA